MLCGDSSDSTEHEKVNIGLVKISKIFQPKIVNIFLPIIFSICFVCSKEPSHGDGSFEYPQHMFWLRNKKKNSVLLSTQNIY